MKEALKDGVLYMKPNCIISGGHFSKQKEMNDMESLNESIKEINLVNIQAIK